MHEQHELKFLSSYQVTAHLLKEAKLMNTSADLCALMAAGVLQCETM